MAQPAPLELEYTPLPRRRSVLSRDEEPAGGADWRSAAAAAAVTGAFFAGLVFGPPAPSGAAVPVSAERPRIFAERPAAERRVALDDLSSRSSAAVERRPSSPLPVWGGEPPSLGDQVDALPEPATPRLDGFRGMRASRN